MPPRWYEAEGLVRNPKRRRRLIYVRHSRIYLTQWGCQLALALCILILAVVVAILLSRSF